MTPYTTKCPTCGKTARAKNVYNLTTKRGTSLECGHFIVEDKPRETPITIIESQEASDGSKLYPFQVRTVQFIERAGGNALIAHEPGLGKTPIAAIFYKLHPENLPVLVICKSSLVVQIQREFVRWADVFLQHLSTSRDVLLPNMKGYIISFDLLRRFNRSDPRFLTPKNESLIEKLKSRDVKSVLVDEVQQIKNSTSQRTAETRAICKEFPKDLGLSGTPIENHAGEYFPFLNILHPEIYPSYKSFINHECKSYWTGFGYKIGGLYNPKQFMEKTKDFIIRYKRSDVLPELPKISRRFQFCDLGKSVEEAYKAEVKNFQQDWYSGFKGQSLFERESNVLAYLSRMRHLTGLSKIDPCIDFVMEFLGGTNRKLTIFCHHKDVLEILRLKLEKLCSELELIKPLTLTAEMNSEQRIKAVDLFTTGEPRILIASTLVGGTGLNLQACSDIIQLERQWNPSKESQAEDRIVRIGQSAEVLTATYFVAVGTVDEFFAELVEQKRSYVGSALDGEESKWNESSIIKELAEVLAQKGGRKWNW